MKDSKTDYAAMLNDPRYEITRTMLRGEIVPTRQLQIITSHMARIQQQVSARLNEGSFWSGDNSLPIDGIVFVGESGSGKSFGLRYATQTMPAIHLSDGNVVDGNAIYVDTPTDGTVGKLAKEIVRCADGVEMREPKDKDAPGRAIAAFARHGFTMVAIDEISRIINPQRHIGRSLTVQSHLVWTMAIEALNLPMSPTPIAMSGLPHVLDSFLIADKKEEAKKIRREAHRRMNIVVLPELDIHLDSPMLEACIKLYCDRAGIKSMLNDEDHIVPRLIHASFNQAGSALEWIQKAVALAKVRPRGKLNRYDFAYVYGNMTSAAQGANPFLATQWDRINVGKVAPRSFADAVTDEERA
jgi:hypothetical protein